MIGLILYATGEVELIKYSDDIFKMHTYDLYINNLCFNYCEYVDTYNYTANYLIDILNNTMNILNNMCGDENRIIINFKKEDIEEIMQSIGS